MRRIALIISCVALLVVVSAHDWLMNERNAGDDPQTFSWNPNQPPCSYIVRPPYSAFRARVVGEVEASRCDDDDDDDDDDRRRRRMSFNSNEAVSRFGSLQGMTSRSFGEGEDYGQGAPADLPRSCQRDWLYWPMFGEHADIGSSSTKAVSCEPNPQKELEYYRLQVGYPGDQELADGNGQLPYGFAQLSDLCPGEGDPTGYYPTPNLQGGTKTTRTAWHFATQGDYYFYSCTDVTVINDTERLRNGADLGQLILRNAYWLVPVALLPVVAASVYSRRHKAESLRLAAMNDMNSRSIYTAKGGDRSITMLSGATAATAKTYASGYTDNVSAGTGMTSRMTGSTGGYSDSTGFTGSSGYSSRS